VRCEESGAEGEGGGVEERWGGIGGELERERGRERERGSKSVREGGRRKALDLRLAPRAFPKSLVELVM
jgi:hypothetical protein